MPGKALAQALNTAVNGLDRLGMRPKHPVTQDAVRLASRSRMDDVKTLLEDCVIASPQDISSRHIMRRMGERGMIYPQT